MKQTTRALQKSLPNPLVTQKADAKKARDIEHGARIIQHSCDFSKALSKAGIEAHGV